MQLGFVLLFLLMANSGFATPRSQSSPGICVLRLNPVKMEEVLEQLDLLLESLGYDLVRGTVEYGDPDRLTLFEIITNLEEIIAKFELNITPQELDQVVQGSGFKIVPRIKRPFSKVPTSTHHPEFGVTVSGVELDRVSLDEQELVPLFLSESQSLKKFSGNREHQDLDLDMLDLSILRGDLDPGDKVFQIDPQVFNRTSLDMLRIRNIIEKFIPAAVWMDDHRIGVAPSQMRNIYVPLKQVP